MYKVAPADVIPTRTDERIKIMNDAQGGVCGCEPKLKKKGLKLSKKVIKYAQTLTNRPIEDRLKFVEMIHEFTDIANSKSAKNAVCAKGCSWCCKVNVDVNPIEAGYIEMKTGYKVVEQPYDKKAGDKSIGYCPFHDEKTATCKIHDYRPLMCRSFFTFDNPDLCIDSSTIHGISSWENVSATKQIWEMLEDMTEGAKDIRYWFDGVSKHEDFKQD